MDEARLIIKKTLKKTELEFITFKQKDLIKTEQFNLHNFIERTKGNQCRKFLV